MEFRLLGSVEASIDGRGVELGNARQRWLLAVLLVEANHSVPTDRLIEYAWSDCRSDRNLPTLYSYLSRLRRAVASADTPRLTRQSGGYLLNVDADAVDLHRFRRLVQAARAIESDAEAAALGERALALWRGEALAGMDTPWATALRAGLDNERAAAELDHADRALRAGQHGALLPALIARADQRPLDERVAGQLLLALYRCGRQADALGAYQHIRRRLAEELGTEPGRQLQDLHQEVLRGTAGLRAPVPESPASSDNESIRGADDGHPTPRQLPASPAWFSGRGNELAAVTKNVLTTDPDATSIVTMTGPGGVGKTWIALRWAHQNIDRFPDGQLFANLRGYTPIGKPLPVTSALRAFLEALGVRPTAIPVDLDAQIGLYRSLISGRRILIVLDNARDTDHVIDLLPGSPTCTVLVTSRDRLAGLVSGHGAHSVPVHLLSDGQARDLLARRLGEEHLVGERQAVAAVVAACTGLPLALGIAAARVALQPELGLAQISAELRDDGTRLQALDEDDGPASLRAALSGSLRALPAQTAEIFVLLGCAVGPDIGLPAAAALTNMPADQAAVALRRLERQSLLVQHRPGRWRMHDLVRLYATEISDQRPQDMRREAQRRLVDFLLHTSHAAAHLLAPQRPSITLDQPVAGGRPIALADQAAAEAWLHTEYECLIAAQQLAVDQRWSRAAWQFAWTVQTFQHRRGYLHDQVAVGQAALDAVEQAADPHAQIHVRRALGRAYAAIARHTDAIGHLQHARALAEQVGDHEQRAHTELALGRACELNGDDEEALRHSTEALRFYQQLDDPVREAVSRNAVGWHATRLGLYDVAATHLYKALELHTRQHDRTYQADTLDSLGYLAFRRGHYAEALNHYQQAQDLLRALGDTYGQADTSAHLGDAHAALGHDDAARHAWQQAMELYREQRRTDDAERIAKLLRSAK